MEKVDLKLVPVEELIQEIMDRSETMVLGYTVYEDPGPPFIIVNHKGSPSWLQAVGLCEALKDDIFTRQKKELESNG